MLRRVAKPWVPHDYQKKAVKFLLSHGAAGLWLDPGLGKTMIDLYAFAQLQKARTARRMLVIAPLRVCWAVWPDEAKKWTQTSHLKVVVLHGPKKEQLLNEDADVFCINYEGLPWLLQKGRLAKLDCDLLSMDEIHKLKHSNTTRFKMLKPFLGRFTRRWGLTGTPAPNGLMDIFGQIYCLDLGDALGPFITAFRNKYFDATGFGDYEWVLKPDEKGDTKKTEEKIYKKIRPLILRIGNDVLGDALPKLVFNDIKIDMPKDAMRVYVEMERKLITMLKDGTKINAVNTAVAAGKCLAEGTEVLTDSGWKRIENFDPRDKLWDGTEWVSANKLLCMGSKPVVECHGVMMTLDHKVMTAAGWHTAKEIIAGESRNEYGRADVRLPDGFSAGRKQNDTRKDAAQTGGRGLWHKICDTLCAVCSKRLAGKGQSATSRVYDIVNAGPRHRFTARGNDGAPLLVHNCLQIANGSVYHQNDETWKRESKLVHKAKIEALVDLVEEIGGKPTLLLYSYDHDRALIRKAFPKAPQVADYSGKKSRELFDKWNRGEITLMVAQPQSIGHGLNLQGGGQHVLWFGLPWDLTIYQQAIDRLHRQGSAFTHVFVHHLMMKGTIDEAVLLALKGKDRTQRGLLLAMKKVKVRNG